MLLVMLLVMLHLKKPRAEADHEKFGMNPSERAYVITCTLAHSTWTKFDDKGMCGYALYFSASKFEFGKRRKMALAKDPP